MKRILLLMTLMTCAGLSLQAQPANERRVSLSEPAIALDAGSAPAIEARLLTQVLNGSDDSPVMNVKIAFKNIAPGFFTYVSGWVTFYDAGGSRCGDGMFKIDMLASQETAEVDTPGLRIRCAPTSWRVVANNLLTRVADIAKPAPADLPAAEPVVTQKPAPTNYIISIDGEEHPIQVNNPVVLRLGSRNRTIVLKAVP